MSKVLLHIQVLLCAPFFQIEFPEFDYFPEIMAFFTAEYLVRSLCVSGGIKQNQRI